MRVIGGSARGRRLSAPRGLSTRPTADRVRQTLFDVLGQRCDGLRVLDLFAGSGALGIEALSRGAETCVFVESSRAALAVLRRNISTLGFGARATVLAGDAMDMKRLRAHGPFDLVLADPPYEVGARPVIDRMAAHGATLLQDGARLVLEHSRREDQPSRVGPLQRADTRRFGDTTLTFYYYDQDRP